MQQEKDEDLRHQLDRDLESLRSLLYRVDPERSTDEAKLDAVVEAPNADDQEYDKAVRELAFEQRAKPKDRTKTDEELALEQKQTLEREERKRQRRMQGEDSDSEDERKRRKRLKQIGGDDLEDDFYGEDGFGPGLEEGVTAGSSEVGEDETEEDEEGEEGPEDDDNDEEDEEGSSARPMTGKELPYTFPCPRSHEEFLGILEGVGDDDVPTVVHRIRTLHHHSLAEDNKLKLQVIHLFPPPSFLRTDTLDL